MPKSLLLLLLLLPLGAVAQQTPLSFEDYDGDDAKAPAAIVVSKHNAVFARVTLDGKLMQLGATEHEVPTNKRMTLHVQDLQPNSTIRVEMQKTGVKVETKRYTANHLGELILEFTTPRKAAGATAKVQYVAANGQAQELKTRVKFR